MPPEVIARAFDSVLHHEADRAGHRPRPVDDLRLRPTSRKAARRSRARSGVGTSISIDLPRHRGGSIEVAAVMETPQLQRGDGETVLVIEDETVVRDLIVEVLHDLGYRAVQASDGPAGLRAPRVDGEGRPPRHGCRPAGVERPPDRRPGAGDAPRPEGAVHHGLRGDGRQRVGLPRPGMAMLTKPFSVDALMTRIQQMIEQA